MEARAHTHTHEHTLKNVFKIDILTLYGGGDVITVGREI